MPNYRRHYLPGASYFFTVNLADRHGAFTLTAHIDVLRAAFRFAKQHRAFDIEAIVVLPDHLHTIWRMPEEDADFSIRWNLLKGFFSKRIPRGEQRSASRASKHERGIWQRRYWDHVIRDERDLHAHFDYIHYNPVKHGHARSPAEWPHSSFLRLVREGWYDVDWAASAEVRELDLG